MDKEQTIIEKFKANVPLREIAASVSLTPQRVTQILIKLGLKEKTSKFTPKITAEIKDRILELNSKGLTVTEISKLVDITPTGIRGFLKKNRIICNIKEVDASRPCVVCGVSVSPTYSDGVKKDKYKTCSKECLSVHLSNLKKKYTKEDVEQVIEAKKQRVPNHIIASELEVDINKVKEIIRDNNLFLSIKDAQRNVYEGKIKKNPNTMLDMRTAYHEKASSPESLENIKNILRDRNYEYISGFDTKTKPFVIRCLTCNKERETSTIHTVVKNSCMHCAGTGVSSIELEIKEWIESFGLKVEKYKFENRTGGREIDIYIPNIQLGIEYCGLYWHNENSPTSRGKTYHYNKMIKSNNNGISLITIFGDEWLNSKKQVKSFLRSKLDKNDIKIYGRDTEIKELDRDISNAFFDRYHIQGRVRAMISLGLFKDEELIAAISGSEHHRIKGQFTLNRLCFKENITVVGGSSKLNSYLCLWAKDKGYDKIVTWSDNRWSEGNVYKSMGYNLEEELGPDYSYVYGIERLSKQSCQKKHLLKKGAVGNTEHEMALSLGYSRIYDCGKKRWVLKLL